MKILNGTLEFAVKLRSSIQYSLITLETDHDPVLSYAGMQRYKTGGAVKLQTLVKRFSENSFRFNILYLVSSCMPVYPEKLIDSCRKKGIKIVWNQNGVGYPAWNKDYKAFNSQMATCLHKADYVIYQSKFCKNSADKFLGKFNGKSSILYNPVDIKKFSPKKRKPFGDSISLLVMGSLRYKERVFLPTAALRLLHKKGINAKLYVGGQVKWPNADKVSGKSVFYLGPYSQQEAPAIYRKGNILIHMQDKDASPTVPLEAMASGLPVIGIKSGGMPELIDNNSGILLSVPQSYQKKYYPTDKEIASSVIKLLKNLKYYTTNARKRALKFSGDKWLLEHKKIFEKLLK